MPRRADAPPTPPAKPPKTSFILPPEVRRELCGDDAPRGALAEALRRVIGDSNTLFGLPAPAVEVLRRDMKSLGLDSQRDYLIWLLMERHRAVLDAAREAA